MGPQKQPSSLARVVAQSNSVAQEVEAIDASKVADGQPGEDLKGLAFQLGYSWPDDEQDQWRVLKLMAIMAAHWRREYEASRSATYQEVERERMYRHQNRRYLATRRKLSNVRRALREFMTAQVAYVREVRQEMIDGCTKESLN